MKFQSSPLSSAILTIVLATTVTFADSFFRCSGAFVVLCFLLFINRRNLAGLVKRLAVINVFSLFIAITFLLSTSSKGGLSPNGVLQPISAILLCCKLNILGTAFFLLFRKIDVSQMASIMKSLRVPDKLGLLITSSWRNISVIEEQYLNLKQAAELRCYKPSLNLHTYKTIGHHIGMTLVLSWMRTKTISQAMLLRGFTGTLPALKEYKSTPTEKLFIYFAGILAFFPFFF